MNSRCANCDKLIIRQNQGYRCGRHRRFCSVKCRLQYHKMHRNEYALPKYDKICPVCGRAFKTGDKAHVCCSVVCRGKSQQTNLNRIVKCVICGKDFTPNYKDKLCCSMACSIIKRTQTAKAKRIEKICVVCGKTYYVDGHHTFSKTCSKACADLIHTRLRRVRLLEGNEQFDAVEIYERDNWICQICHKPTKRGVNGRNPLQPSLDHIIPLSLGGSHTRNNVRCTHLVCNTARKNKGAAQLLLVG